MHIPFDPVNGVVAEKSVLWKPLGARSEKGKTGGRISHCLAHRSPGGVSREVPFSSAIILGGRRRGLAVRYGNGSQGGGGGRGGGPRLAPQTV